MKIFTNTGTTAYDIVHMDGDIDDYTLTESNGKLTYSSEVTEKTYILNTIEAMTFKYSNGTTNKFKWINEYLPFATTLGKLDLFNDGSGVALFNLSDSSIIGPEYNLISSNNNYDTGIYANAMNTSSKTVWEFINPIPTTNLTISFWAMVDNTISFTSGWNGFLKGGSSYLDNGELGGSRDCFGLFYNEISRDLAHFGCGNSNGGVVNFNLSATWTHIVLSREGDYSKVYANGVLVRERVEGLPVNSLRYLSVGDGSGNHQGNGIYVDQLRIITKGVTQEEVNILMTED